MPSITVRGMTCNHCKASVTQALSVIPGVTSVEVNLETGETKWGESDHVDVETIKNAIRRIGFEVDKTLTPL